MTTTVINSSCSHSHSKKSLCVKLVENVLMPDTMIRQTMCLFATMDYRGET